MVAVAMPPPAVQPAVLVDTDVQVGGLGLAATLQMDPFVLTQRPCSLQDVLGAAPELGLDEGTGAVAAQDTVWAFPDEPASKPASSPWLAPSLPREEVVQLHGIKCEFKFIRVSKKP